jgi:hypothetical protein
VLEHLVNLKPLSTFAIIKLQWRRGRLLSAVRFKLKQQPNVKHIVAPHVGKKVQAVRNRTENFCHSKGTNVLRQELVNARHFENYISCTKQNLITY